MDDGEIFANHRKELERFSNDFQLKLSKTIVSYGDCVRFYAETMQNFIKEAEQYSNQAELFELHSKTKNKSVSQV